LFDHLRFSSGDFRWWTHFGSAFSCAWLRKFRTIRDVSFPRGDTPLADHLPHRHIKAVSAAHLAIIVTEWPPVQNTGTGPSR